MVSVSLPSDVLAFHDDIWQDVNDHLRETDVIGDDQLVISYTIDVESNKAVVVRDITVMGDGD